MLWRGHCPWPRRPWRMCWPIARRLSHGYRCSTARIRNRMTCAICSKCILFWIFPRFSPAKPQATKSACIANELQLKDKYQARVRLTGSVPMADEEFGSVQDGALENAIGTIIVVLTILWLALKSPPHHSRGHHQPVRRLEPDCRTRPCHGRRAQHDIGCVRRPVRRTWRRFRHSIRGAISCGTP